VDRLICPYISNLPKRDQTPLLWTPEEIKQVDELKQAPITAPVLALPSPEQPFHLFVNVNKGVVLGLLTQKHGFNVTLWPSYLNS
jgi:hypothetical protein